MSIFAAVRRFFAWLDGDTSPTDIRSTATYSAMLLQSADPYREVDPLTPARLPRCLRCQTIFRPLVDGGRSCSLLCARCAGRPLAGRSRDEVRAAEEKARTRRLRKRAKVEILRRKRS